MKLFRPLAAHRTRKPGRLAAALGIALLAAGLLASSASALPDARQYQLVSPPEKSGALIAPLSELGAVQAAADGHALTYIANAPIEASPPGTVGEPQVLSARSPAGWSTRNIAPPRETAPGIGAGQGSEYRLFSTDLSTAILQPFGPFDPLLSPAATEPTAYLRSLDPACGGSSCYRPLVTACPALGPCPPAVQEAANLAPGTPFGEAGPCTKGIQVAASDSVCGPRYRGASPDLSHVVLSSQAPLLPAARGAREQLYEYSSSSGALSIVSLLPENGAGEELPAPEERARLGALPNGASAANARRAVSADGTRVFWELRKGAFANALYMRDTEPGHETTIQLDVKEPACGACESGGGEYQLAAADGSRVFFTDEYRLTADSGGGGSSSNLRDLYECRILEPAPGEPECELTDLTPKRGGESAAALGAVLGASEDGSYLYFAANGVLAANTVENGAGPETAQPGNCPSEITGPTPSGACNLYLLHAGTISFVAPLAAADRNDWATVVSHMPARVSPSGRWLAFMSQGSPTGYDNHDAVTGQPDAEAYLYDAATARLRCASCNPSGARPRGIEYDALELAVGGREVWENLPVAANLPGYEAFETTAAKGGGPESAYQTRYLSDSGRLFFNAFDGLAPKDSNGTVDVYQYEPPGVGDCAESSPTFSAQNGGCVGLISSGASKRESAFLDASENGDDVFFLTSSKLVPADVDTSPDVYDAHLCTAEVPCLPEPPPPAPACAGDACQQPAVPPGETTPTSLSFEGAGNLTEKPAKKKHHHKKHRHRKRRHRKRSHKRANADRRAHR